MNIDIVADYHTYTNIPKGRVWGFNKIVGNHAKGTILENAKIAAERNTAFEIDRKHKNIKTEDITKLRDMGVMFSLGSDSHHSNTVGEFGIAYNIAIDAGLTNDNIINANGEARKKIKYLR